MDIWLSFLKSSCYENERNYVGKAFSYLKQETLNFFVIDILQNTVLGKRCCWVLVLQKKWAPVYHRTFAVSQSFIAKSRGGGFVLCERAKEKTVEWLTSSNSNQRRRRREKSPLSLPPLIVVCTMYVRYWWCSCLSVLKLKIRKIPPPPTYVQRMLYLLFG